LVEARCPLYSGSSPHQALQVSQYNSRPPCGFFRPKDEVLGLFFSRCVDWVLLLLLLMLLLHLLLMLVQHLLLLRLHDSAAVGKESSARR